MRRLLSSLAITASVSLAAPATLHAQDADNFNNLRFEIGGGIAVAPEYEGASDYEIAPAFIGRFVSLQGLGLNLGGDDTRGLSIGPSFRYLSERSPDDDPSLAGTEEIDASIELGLAVSYEWDYLRTYGQMRYGVTGHEGIVGEAGIEAIYRPDPSTRITFGPRISFANETYMDTYFSVPTGAALPSYTASGGFKSAGLAAAIRHDFNDQWAIEASAGWDRLIGDAADSPIVKAGSEDQFSGKIGIIRKFSFDF